MINITIIKLILQNYKIIIKIRKNNMNVKTKINNYKIIQLVKNL